MEGDFTFNGKYNGLVHLDYLPCLNYAMFHNGYESCDSFELQNNDDVDWNHVQLIVDGELIQTSEVLIDAIPKRQRLEVKDIKIAPDVTKLVELTERVDTFFYLTLCIDGEEAMRKEYPISLMTFDQWPGASVVPELLASFVTPNHPILSRISVNASKFMEKWTGDSAMDEYQTQDPNRVRMQVAAIYEALRSESIVYVTPPASFEKTGQRVRLVDKVLNEKVGTCVDLSLLYASCLEAIGIHPLLILIKGHMFVGAWLTPDIYSQTVGDDASFLLKGAADGINDLVLVEATALTSSQDLSFDDAVFMAEKHLKDEKNFIFFIDVFRCRLNNIRPIPQRVEENGKWSVKTEGVKHSNATEEVMHLNRYDIKTDEPKGKITKQILWERKLLDFSLRNNLINIRIGKRVIPFISFDIDHLEDHLQEGETYQILPSPSKNKLDPEESGIYDSSKWKTSMEELITNEIKNKKLYSYLTDTELQNTLKFIYRTSRTAMEENGANSLFVAVGLLKWYETARSIKQRFAPILLLPVDIIRKGGAKGYVIRMRDEDTILNTTLVELLKQEFGLNLSGLNPLPKDESGVDVKQILAIVRNSVREMKGWDVLDEAMLGIFSFNKFVMWNDIHTNADKLKENPVIKSLMDGRVQWKDDDKEVDARQIDKEVEPANFAIPLDVDSSQMESVIESGQGKSFILHGPPGTGKSQTITNMIANALYKGKRVLFVAEKMAALSVVQKRLAKIGLDPFCLEMHSNKATKSHFLSQLQQAIDVVHIKSPEEFDKLSKELFERRQSLIGYMEALHRPHSSGLSLYDCITNYLSVTGDEIQVSEDVVANMNKDRLTKIRETITDLDTVMKITGHPQEHPLRHLKPKTLDATDTIKEKLDRYKRIFIQLIQQKPFFTNQLALGLPDTADGLNRMRVLSDLLAHIPVLNKAVLDLSANNELLEEWKDAVQNGKRKDEIKERLLKDFSEDVLKQDAQTLQFQWKTIQTKWFLPKFFAKRSFVNKLKVFNPTLKSETVPGLLEDLARYQQSNKIVAEHSGEWAEKFGLLGREGKEKWDSILSTLEDAPKIYAQLRNHANEAGLPIIEVLSGFSRQLGNDWNLFKEANGSTLNQLNELFAELEKTEQELQPLCDMELPKERIGTRIPQLIDQWIANLHLMKDWYQWCYRERDLNAEQLKGAVDYIQEQHKSGKEAADALFKGISHQMAVRIVNADSSLQLFNGLLFESVIEKYRQLTADFQEITKKALYSKLAARIPNMLMEASNSSELGILKRNIANGGRGTSIRRIIDQIPNLLPKLCPCMLMSPISVAQYIDLNTDKFDIVIFDEASQMPTSEAVGAIARGKALVVVGDPKQMPPTSFFSTTQVDEEEADIDDMESILDDCISLSMPSRYLTWHYRSKHESLIAFSNAQYYDGKLYTFPSVDDRVSKVQLVKVDGSYDKGHTRSNRAEAEAIVKEVIRRLKDEELSKRSIGIVSFSIVQQNLIEDILTEELAKSPDLEAKAYDAEEPIFIKNLENVQGDERDVILFSVGYGPDKSGNVSMNFGPLNNQGGERRLNVAVSRARYEMIIFSTLRPEQIDLRRSKAKGVEGLKKFLEFAERGTSAISINQSNRTTQSEMVNVIAQDLKEKGYTVDTFVGRSNFKIDLAVLDPKHPDTYLLGILCDGKNYYETKTTRDREICQPNVLNMLHWHIMRIWSVDWFENKEKVLERIVKKLDDLQKAKEEKQTVEPTPTYKAKAFNVADEPVVEFKNEREKPYVFAKLNVQKTTGIEKMEASAERVRKQLREILSVEQPMTNTLLYKRIASQWQIPRVTPRLQQFIDSQLICFYMDQLSTSETRIYWESKEASIDYPYYRVDSKRDILDIPILEVMNAVHFVVEQQISIPLDDLKKMASQLLGFARRGANVDMQVMKAINLLIGRGILVDNNGNMMLK